MTTRFDSSEGSLCGAVEHSDVDERNHQWRPWWRNIAFVVWQDEACGQAYLGEGSQQGEETDYHTANYEEDYLRFNALRESIRVRGWRLRGGFLHMSTYYPTQPVFYRGVVPHSRFREIFVEDPDVEYERVLRPPGLNEAQDLHERIVAPFEAAEQVYAMLLLADISGSTDGGADFQPTLSEYSSWVNGRGYGALEATLDSRWNTERWVGEITRLIAEKMDENR